MSDDLPIAHRRTRRSTSALRDETEDYLHHELPTAILSSRPVMPIPSRKAQNKKRVRFSEPGPSQDHLDDPSSTGLTPMVRRTTLAPNSNRRRHSTPAGPLSGNGISQPLDTTADAECSEITFLPLRQVLDGRVKRRIRRNGLSEEMNNIYTERKLREQEIKAELEALRAEVAAKNEQIRRLRDGSAAHDEHERAAELVQQIEELRQELLKRSGVDQRDDNEAGNGSSHLDWTKAARDPFSNEHSDMGMDVDFDEESDDEQFGNRTMAELVCSTPSRRAEARHSFPTPPSTSPVNTGPFSACSHVLTPTSHAGVQVTMPDAEKQELEEELASLQLEICKLTTTLESYESMTSRISDKVAPFASDKKPVETERTPAAALEANLKTLLRNFSDRTAALVELNSSIGELGFSGNDASDMVSSLSTAFRTARLELEYLTPGEIALPLTSAGSAVLDLLLTRLRHLSRQAQESDNAIDEYHTLEQSLRQQLSARVEAMDGMAREMKVIEGESRTKDAQISELEVGVERLKGAVETYARDVSGLEKLISRMEGQVETANANCQKEKEDNEADVREWTTIFNDKESTISTLEGKLATAVLHTAELREQVSALHVAQMELQTRHKDELVLLNKTHGSSLALRDSRVSELRLEMDRVNEALCAAHETVRQLRLENNTLSSRLDAEKAKTKVAINAMRGELERVARMSQDFLATPKKSPSVAAPFFAKRLRSGSMEGSGVAAESVLSPIVRPGTFLTGDLARRKSNEIVSGNAMGRKRRKYDSGLGFLDEEDVDA